MHAPNFRTLDLNLLRVFDQVMTERNLTRAARNLAMTQPAVSNALNRLRESLGDKLVSRSGYGVEPTPRAQALWPAISDALRQLEASITPGDFVAASASNTFTISMADATAAELMPGLVEIIERDAPGVSMRVLPLTTRDPRRLLDEGHIDLAVGYFPAVLADLTSQAQSGGLAAFDHQRLYDGEYVCVMRKGHALASGPMTLNRYCKAHHLLVSFSGRPFGFIDEALASLGRERRVVLTVNQFFTAGRVVASSDLLTVLPRHFVSVTGMAHELVLRELPFKVPPVHVDALWHRRQSQRSDHAWLRLAVAAVARKAFGDPNA
ncbi:LysR family transcriptional regulator [Caenimonas sedimenti]|uniref:LysR family transcriptional regulator n=1 Tax=Caenimonas sedimenti TaxID=2596921 RepID=A0A562ZRU0_9BURK|nr:LysR family transcriptional regulator [Caenimonas sedimenti]TWO71028.1 LysR family transcriptional regulator [Caenimonas sedimenti]